jgi:ClpP class serine protease
MTRAFRALTAEPWAIEASWLPLLAAIASRHPQRPAAPAQTHAGHDISAFAGPAGRRLEGAYNTVVTGDGVALIPVFGPIFPRANLMTEISGATTCQNIGQDLRLALASPEVGAIMLLIDSPGGQVSGIAALADQVFAARKAKPVVTYVMGTMASAAFWVGAQSQSTSGDRTCIVGSVGVMAGVAKQMEPDQDGEMSFDIVSSNAANKNPDPSTEEGQAPIRTMLDGLEAEFIASLAKGRGVTAKRVIADFGQGGVFVGAAAVEAGMIDQIASFDVAYAGVAKQVANQRKVQSLKA